VKRRKVKVVPTKTRNAQSFAAWSNKGKEKATAQLATQLMLGVGGGGGGGGRGGEEGPGGVGGDFDGWFLYLTTPRTTTTTILLLPLLLLSHLIPTDIADSLAWSGKISAMINQAIHPGPKAKKMMTPVMATTLTFSQNGKLVAWALVTLTSEVVRMR